MKALDVEASIRATPQVVWDLLTDAAGFPAGDSTYSRIDGRVLPGETIILHRRVLKPKVLRVKVSAFEPSTQGVDRRRPARGDVQG
jgi:hypothetical protein